jgi:hypothetical protein
MKRRSGISGIPEPVVGKQVLWGDDGARQYYVTVVGVAKDYHFTSLRNQIKPFCFCKYPPLTPRVANFTIKNVKLQFSRLAKPGTIVNTWKSFPQTGV